MIHRCDVDVTSVPKRFGILWQMGTPAVVASAGFEILMSTLWQVLESIMGPLMRLAHVCL